MSYFLYSALLALGMLISLPYWLYRILRYGKYRTGFVERMGQVPQRLLTHDSLGDQRKAVVWLHAVSVGEVLAIRGLADEIRRSLPQHRVLVSTTTPTGQELARRHFGQGSVFYFPMDFAFAIRPYLRGLQPELVILAETEFWPNFLRMAHNSGARIAVVNARVSDRSWPSYRRFRWALRRMLAHVDLFLAQTQEDADRLRSIGAGADRIRVTGNLKFDVSRSAVPPIVEKLRQSLAEQGAGPVLVCGSTVDGEEPPLLKAFEYIRAERPRAVMILAPRRPERFDDVATLLQQLGISFIRRSRWQGEVLAGGVLLVDTIGELAALYALADVAFVGGSLVPRGGHNIIEPAQYGVAIIVGPHNENFRDIVSLFQRRDAVRIVTLAELPLNLLQLLANDQERRSLGRRAEETMRSQAGATARTLDALMGMVENCAPRPSAEAAHND